MKQSLMKTFAASMLPLLLAGTLTGCMTAEELAHHNALMDETVTRSTATMSETVKSPHTYEERLRFALKNASPSVMEEIHKTNAIIRLDNRLAHVKSGFFEVAPYMGYYNDGKQIVITISDTGRIDLPFRLRDQAYDPDTIAEGLKGLFLWHIDKEDLSKPAVKFGFRHYDSCGKQICQNVQWSDASEWWKIINKNSSLNLIQPPGP